MPADRDRFYRAAHAEYAQFRTIAYERALHEATVRGIATQGTRITPISADAVRAFRETWSRRPHWTADGGWPWDQLVVPFLKKPRAFHAALWEDDELCGLAVGKSLSRQEQDHAAVHAELTAA